MAHRKLSTRLRFFSGVGQHLTESDMLKSEDMSVIRAEQFSPPGHIRFVHGENNKVHVHFDGNQKDPKNFFIKVESWPLRVPDLRAQVAEQMAHRKLSTRLRFFSGEGQLLTKSDMLKSE